MSNFIKDYLIEKAKSIKERFEANPDPLVDSICDLLGNCSVDQLHDVLEIVELSVMVAKLEGKSPLAKNTVSGSIDQAGKVTYEPKLRGEIDHTRIPEDMSNHPDWDKPINHYDH